MEEKTVQDPLLTQTQAAVDLLIKGSMGLGGAGMYEASGLMAMGAQTIRVLWNELVKARAETTTQTHECTSVNQTGGVTAPTV